MTASTAAKKTSPRDWHPAEVVAALRMGGYSLRQLSLLNGYGNPGSLAKALHRPYPLAEAIIAEALGLAPEAVWPSRYGCDGQPNRQRGPKTLLPANAQPSRLRLVRNAQRGVGA